MHYSRGFSKYLYKTEVIDQKEKSATNVHARHLYERLGLSSLVRSGMVFRLKMGI